MERTEIQEYIEACETTVEDLRDEIGWFNEPDDPIMTEIAGNLNRRADKLERLVNYLNGQLDKAGTS